MAVTVVQITKITCDGDDQPCPSHSEISLQLPQSVALRQAARTGWSLKESVACPACSVCSTAKSFIDGTYRAASAPDTGMFAAVSVS